MQFAALPALFPVYATAEEKFPGKQIAVVVPTTPGATTDIIARVLSDSWRKYFQTNVLVENKAGATGAIGAQFVARATPDGNTVLVGPGSTMVLNPMVSETAYDPLKELKIIGVLGKAETVIVANSETGFKNLGDVINFAKKNPGKLTYGSSGTGSTLHLAMEYLQMLTGVTMLHVPFKGTSPAEAALLGNQVSFMLSNTSSVEPHIKSGRLTPLAITSTLPWKKLTNVSNASDTVPNFVVDTWLGLYVPNGVSAVVAEKLNAGLNAFLSESENVEAMRARGFGAMKGSLKDAEKFLDDDIKKWRQTVEKVKKEGKL